MMSLKSMRCALLALLVQFAVPVLAGGPMIVGGPNAGVEGQPFVWSNASPIAYRVDGGPLGSVSNTTAVSMVTTAFSRWSSIPTAKLSFHSLGTITGVPGGDVITLADFNTVYSSCQSGSQSPIIFDNNTSLLYALTGDSNVVGLTGPCALTSDGHIQSAFSILGNPQGMTSAELLAVMVHEFGHFIGLDHSDVGEPLSTGTTQADVDNIPTMYWALTTTNQALPKIDDRAWVSKLYPSTTFSANYGLIRGTVFFSDGQYPVQDFLVVARKIDDIHATAIGSISGYRYTGNPGQPYTADYLACNPASSCPNGFYGNNQGGSSFGSRDATLIGTFELPVPPGEYYVEVHGQAGGAIGPITPMLNPPGPEGYWPTGTYFGAQTVTVSAGQTVEGINTALRNTPAPFDIFDDVSAHTSSTQPPAGGSQ